MQSRVCYRLYHLASFTRVWIFQNMQIVDVPVNDLKPADYNPRSLTRDQYAQLKESLERFGFLDPIVVNSNEARMNVIIGGHQRWHVAKDLGFETVPVVYVNLDEAMEREANLRLNKNVGSWDMDALANLFSEDLLLSVGFTDIELHGVPPPAPMGDEEKKSSREPKGWKLKCPNCGFDGSEDAFDKLKEGEQKQG